MAVITISRQFGAGGRTLGRMIADQLGYTFADNLIVTRIAEAARVAPHWVETEEKEAGTNLSRIISKMVSKVVVDKIVKEEQGYLDEQLYLDYLVVIIAQIAEEGNAVILGRGAQYILSDHPDTYHILLTDKFENRVKFMEKHYNYSTSEAIKIVKNEDKRRLNLYRKIGKTDYDDPLLYHLVLNMSKVSLEKAKQLIIELIH